jgi:hypothetical protein
MTASPDLDFDAKRISLFVVQEQFLLQQPTHLLSWEAQFFGWILKRQPAHFVQRIQRSVISH